VYAVEDFTGDLDRTDRKRENPTPKLWKLFTLYDQTYINTSAHAHMKNTG
jgi:hypothetical protein